MINLFKKFANILDWEKRAEGENGFFIEQLKRYGCKEVFDSAAGEGYDTVTLAKAGFNMTSNDTDTYLIVIAKERTQKEGLEVIFTEYDWRTIPNSLENTYDAVVCLGNSLTMLLEQEEHKSAVNNFYKIIKPGGILILDHRNYDYMLREREHILKDPLENFRYSKKYYYCSDDSDIFPVVIEDKKVVLGYDFHGQMSDATLDTYPFRREEVMGLIGNAGFTSIETYGDFEINKIEPVDFYQHIGKK